MNQKMPIWTAGKLHDKAFDFLSEIPSKNTTTDGQFIDPRLCVGIADFRYNLECPEGYIQLFAQPTKAPDRSYGKAQIFPMCLERSGAGSACLRSNFPTEMKDIDNGNAKIIKIKMYSTLYKYLSRDSR